MQPGAIHDMSLPDPSGNAQEPASEPHILVVEDDGETRRLLVRLLRENGSRATGVTDGEEMWQALVAATPELLLLDLMLPKRSGLELLRDLRRDVRWANLPVVIVTARGEVGDRTRGLELGADDYVAKPFDRRELLARINAVLRRTAGPGQLVRGNLIRFSGWQLDTGKRTLTSPHGSTVDLSGAEYDLLTVFLDNPKRALSRERLLELARNRISITATDRSVDVQVSRLRQKLEVEGESRGLIKTVRGVGYVLAADVDP
jgi:two-component system OmpR family response regulator